MRAIELTVMVALMGVASPVRSAPRATPVVVEGRSPGAQTMASAMTQIKASVGDIAPTPVEEVLPHHEYRSEVMNHTHGGLWVVGTDHVAACGNMERSGLAEAVATHREAEEAIDQLQYELAEALLEGAFKSYACLNEDVALSTMWRHYVLAGIAALGQGLGRANGERKIHEDKARAFFVRAHRVLPGQAWDTNYPPQFQVPYEQANSDLLRERLAGDRGRQPYDALVEVIGAPETLTINGSEVPKRLAPGNYLLQWDRDGAVYSRVVTVEEEVGVTIRLVTQEGWLAALSAFPDKRTPAQGAIVEATVKHIAKGNLPGLVVLSFSEATPRAMHYRLETGTAPTPIDIHLPQEEAEIEGTGVLATPPARGGAEGVGAFKLPPPRLAFRPAAQVLAISRSWYGGFSITVEGHIAKDLWVGAFGTGGFTRWDGVPYGLATAGATLSWHFHPTKWLEPFVVVGGELEWDAPPVLGAFLFGGGAEVVFHPQVRLRVEIQGGVGGQADRATPGRFRVTLGPTLRMPERRP